ncbi:unnamed protein product [Durusdinium trenchii]|uniref:ACB domain-containing protein n=1 Tax=Durusdinium trenchii TaxID=1381693 RepID=A0ABP0I452_9DINO
MALGANVKAFILSGSLVGVGVLYYWWQRRRRTSKVFQRDNHEVIVMADARLFEEACAWVGQNGANLPTSAALELYAFYKQATCGDCPTSRPMGFQAAAKWDAWSQLAGCQPELAQVSYVQALDTLVPNWQFGGELDETQVSRGNGAVGELSMGPAVSTMGVIGGDDADVDETPAGQLCQKIADGDFEAASSLLRASPHLAAQADKDGMLPLHWAADRGDLDMVQFLLEIPEARAMISAPDAAGDTALHYSVMSENEMVAQLLVAKGASVNLANEAGETPETLAQEGGEQKILGPSG